MTGRSTSLRLVGIALVASIGVVSAACDTPTTPTRQMTSTAPPVSVVPPAEAPPGPPAAVLSVESFTLVTDYSGALAARLKLAETGGRSSAVVISLGFNLADGAPWSEPVAWRGGWLVPAGGTVSIEPRVLYGDYEFTFQVPLGYRGRISALVSFADAEGRRGTVTAVTALPQ